MMNKEQEKIKKISYDRIKEHRITKTCSTYKARNDFGKCEPRQFTGMKKGLSSLNMKKL